MKKTSIRLISLCGLLPFSGLTLAHTGAYETSSLVSGVLHPFTGLDHMLTMLAIGLWLVMSKQKSKLPITSFAAFMFLGAVLSMSGLVLPGIETGIAVSLLIAGLLVAVVARLPVFASATLLGVFAVFYGGAHGAEMPTAATPLLYVIGFALSTLVLYLGSLKLGEYLQRLHAQWLLRSAGILTSGLGVWLLLTA